MKLFLVSIIYMYVICIYNTSNQHAVFINFYGYIVHNLKQINLDKLLMIFSLVIYDIYNHF